MRSPTTWALVSNGVRARILRNIDADDAKILPELLRKTRARHLRDLLTDRPGRSFAADARGRRSATDAGSDPILRDMQDFARDVGAFLDDAQRAGKFGRLALLATPKMLGILRRTFPTSLRDCVILERPANLVWLPEAELRRAIREMLREEQKEGSQ